MHFYCNKQLPNDFDEYFIPISSIHPTPQDYLLLTCLYLEITFIQENVPLHLLAQKSGLQYQAVLNRLQLLP